MQYTLQHSRTSERHEEQNTSNIEQVVQAYQTSGFKIKAILADGQFKHIQQIIEQKRITLDICVANEHVPEI